MQQTVVLVEDNPSDVEIVEEAIKREGLHVKLQVFTDGAAAQDYIHGMTEHSGARTPDLLILDLNLPWITGDELLREVRANPKSAGIPVIVTSSAIGHPAYLKRISKSGADRIFQKPLDLEGSLEIGPMIRELLEREPAPKRQRKMARGPRPVADSHLRVASKISQ